MAKSSFCANAFVAPDSAQAHLAPRLSCNLVFKKAARQASISLEFPLAIQDPDDQRAIILVYDADILSSGEQSCNSLAAPFHIQSEEHAAIARNNSAGIIKHLTLTIKGTCCKVLIPRCFENTKPDPEFIALYDQAATLAQAIKVHVLFDYNYVHKNHRKNFMHFVHHPDRHLVHVSCEEGSKQIDPFGPCKYATPNPPPYTIVSNVLPDHNDRLQYSPTDKATTVASPSTPLPHTFASKRQPEDNREPQCSPTEKGTIVGTPSTPPLYTASSNGRPRHNHGLQYLPIDKATTVAYPSTQSPCTNASHTRARQAAQNSASKVLSMSVSMFEADVKRPEPRYSPDIHAPILHDVVRNAVDSRLAEMLRDVLPDMLQCAFEAASPPNSNPRRLDSSLKDSIRAVCSEEVAVLLEDKVDDITQNLDSYAEVLRAALEEEWKEEVENVILAIQEESVLEVRKVTRHMIRKIKATGRRILEGAESVNGEAAELVRSSNMCNDFQITPRKRAGDGLAPGSSKRMAYIDDFRGEVSRDAQALEGISASAVQKIDHQSDAIAYFVKHFAALDVQLQLAVIEAFEVEFAAKTFVLLTLKLKKAWVQLQLKRRRDSLCCAGVNLDLLVTEIEWDKEGDVTRKVVEHVD